MTTSHGPRAVYSTCGSCPSTAGSAVTSIFDAMITRESTFRHWIKAELRLKSRAVEDASSLDFMVWRTTHTKNELPYSKG